MIDNRTRAQMRMAAAIVVALFLILPMASAQSTPVRILNRGDDALRPVVRNTDDVLNPKVLTRADDALSPRVTANSVPPTPNPVGQAGGTNGSMNRRVDDLLQQKQAEQRAQQALQTAPPPPAVNLAPQQAMQAAPSTSGLAATKQTLAQANVPNLPHPEKLKLDAALRNADDQMGAEITARQKGLADATHTERVRLERVASDSQTQITRKHADDLAHTNHQRANADQILANQRNHSFFEEQNRRAAFLQQKDWNIKLESENGYFRKTQRENERFLMEQQEANARHFAAQRQSQDLFEQQRLRVSKFEEMQSRQQQKLALEQQQARASSEKELVQRAMSRDELEATRSTGLLRGGREGTHYVSDAVNTANGRARQRLALEQTPEVRVTFEVSSSALSPPAFVAPRFNMPGGGLERTATGNVPVRILRVDGY